MTEFTQTLRHYCRNPRCRSKLPSPASDPHKAFCTRGCHSSFYLKRCLVCEGDKPDGSQLNRRFCRRPRCKAKYQKNRALFDLSVTSGHSRAISAPDAPRSAQSTGIKSAHKDDRPWRLVAGPMITAGQYHCATVPDGPDCQWAEGEWRRIEGRNRGALKTVRCSPCAPQCQLLDNTKSLSN